MSHSTHSRNCTTSYRFTRSQMPRNWYMLKRVLLKQWTLSLRWQRMTCFLCRQLSFDTSPSYRVCAGGGQGSGSLLFQKQSKGWGGKVFLQRKVFPFHVFSGMSPTTASLFIFVCKGVLTERSFATKFKWPPTHIFLAHGLLPSPNNVILCH